MDVDAGASLFQGCELKLNSYDLGVDIELADAVQRLRFEHPEVRAVVLRSGKEGVFCAGANIRMLGRASHTHKVNFCKFTNETRCAIEDCSRHSGQTWLAAISGTAAGGGYELALATEHIMLIDDRRASVSLPEVPLLAVLPGTGGLTRLTDKRRVRRDLADLFCTIEEGVRGRRAVAWRIVDEVVPPTAWDRSVGERALALAARSDRPDGAVGIELPPLIRHFAGDKFAYPYLRVDIDRARHCAVLTIAAPSAPLPGDIASIHAAGADFWPLAVARALDDAILHLRFNEPELGLLVLRTLGEADRVLAADALLDAHASDWLVREIRLYLKRVLSRLDLTARSLIVLIEPASCFAGTLAEIAFAADRALAHEAASVALSRLNFGAYPMANGLTRLAARFLGESDNLASAQTRIGVTIPAPDAAQAGLVTLACDAIDWDDEVRIMLEERASFSPDALTAMEANLRFAGPETMETRIFGRLTAWQNWIFQRPNAVGERGALRRYGSGVKASFDTNRV